jgi:gas vesicle protein
VVHQEPSTPLPPAGDERKEELKKREDVLQEKAEQISDKNEVYAINPDAMKVDNELAQFWDAEDGTMLGVTDPIPGRAYNWANHSSQHGVDVKRKMSRGWKVVSGNDPECTAARGADGTRRIGDLMLMWMPVELSERIKERDKAKAEKIYGRNSSINQEIEDLARKRPNSFVLHEPRSTSKTGDLGQMIQSAGASDLARTQATRMLGNMLKNEIPGLPIPGRK